MLLQYPEIARSVTHQPTGRLSAIAINSALITKQIVEEIDAGRPVIAGISPGGFSFLGQSQHVALIIGYEGDAENLTVTVNDPFPYVLTMFQGHPDPYLAAGGRKNREGQYDIGYRAFRTRLLWGQSIYGIQCSGSACP
jgi:hypothetical protein